MHDNPLEHIDSPTFEKILAASGRRSKFVTVTIKDRSTVTCRASVAGTRATIDFDLINLGSTFSDEAQKRYRAKHDPYLQANKKRLKGGKPGFALHFGPNSIRFEVHVEDASDWFDDIYGA